MQANAPLDPFAVKDDLVARLVAELAVAIYG
jgi:hypothetical protein